MYVLYLASEGAIAPEAVRPGKAMRRVVFIATPATATEGGEVLCEEVNKAST